MKWAEALKLSRVGKAVRPRGTEAVAPQTDPDEIEPDIVLLDPKADNPKAFQTFGSTLGWKRIKLRRASEFDDWEAVDPKDIVTRIGEIKL